VGSVLDTVNIKGKIVGFANLVGEIKASVSFSGTIEAGGVVTRDIYPRYTGEIEVTPKVNEDVVLDTDWRVVTNDIIIKPIPDYETSNPYGTTFIIG
jgi:hypothetical protein